MTTASSYFVSNVNLLNHLQPPIVMEPEILVRPPTFLERFRPFVDYPGYEVSQWVSLHDENELRRKPLQQSSSGQAIMANNNKSKFSWMLHEEEQSDSEESNEQSKPRNVEKLNESNKLYQEQRIIAPDSTRDIRNSCDTGVKKCASMVSESCSSCLNNQESEWEEA